MTTDERQMLSELADKLAKTPAPPKDPEAEDFIRSRIGNRPDALYVMTQTVLIQNMALEQAQKQLAQQQGQSGSGSFLGGGGGQQQYAPSGQAQYAPPPQQPAYGTAPAQQLGGQPSFLRGAAQTAAGVAAGALAFEGIRSLFSHPGYGSEGLMGGGGFGGGETVVNNYYDSPRDSGGYDAGGRDDLQLTDNRDSFVGSNASDDASYDDGGDNLADDGGDYDTGGDDNFS